MQKKNVLLIENCFLDVILIKESLQQNGEFCNINLFEDGFEAVVQIENLLPDQEGEIPDLIIANEELIVINGVNILSHIKSLNHFYIPVIILTSTGPYGRPPFNKGACSYINKPLEVMDFIEVFKEIKGYWLTMAN